MMDQNTCNCDHCKSKSCVYSVPIFAALDRNEIDKITSLIIKRHYKKGELIVIEGETLEGLIIVNRGQVKAFRSTQDGKEQILYIFSEGDFFGEKNLFRNRKASYSVEALEETSICMIHKTDFKQLLHKHIDIAIKIMEELSERLEKLESAIESMSTKSVEDRISSILLEFAKKYGKPHPKGILFELPLSQEGIANYIGLARETVSRKMNRLKDEGIIEMVGNKKVIILNKEMLENGLGQ